MGPKRGYSLVLQSNGHRSVGTAACNILLRLDNLRPREVFATKKQQLERFQGAAPLQLEVGISTFCNGQERMVVTGVGRLAPMSLREGISTSFNGRGTMDENGPGRHLKQLKQAATQILFNMPLIKGAQD